MNIREFKIMLRRLRSRLLDVAFYFVPANKDKVVFDNFDGRGYGCNPKYIAEALHELDPQIELVWIVRKNTSTDNFPEYIKPVLAETIKAKYEWASAKVWVDNVRTFYKAAKKESQLYIQTWHSSLGLKKVEAAANPKGLQPRYIKDAKFDSGRTDLMFANNQFRVKQYSTDFWYKGKVLLSGVPRNSVIYNPPDSVKPKVYETYGINRGEKIVLYAPTFRSKFSETEVYKFDFLQCLRAIENKFGSSYVMLLRLHPNTEKYSEFVQYSEKVINATGYEDMQELLAAADLLITDYSSCMFDFAFTERPVVLFAKDFDEYIHGDQGLLFEFGELPFTLSKSSQELCNEIALFDMDAYKGRCQEFFKRIGLKEDGKGDKEIASIIIRCIREGKGQLNNCLKGRN